MTNISKTLDIDFSNESQLEDLMNRADDFPEVMLGTDDDGSYCTIQITVDYITHRKIANNGKQYEVHVYWKDGTMEEFYEPMDL